MTNFKKIQDLRGQASNFSNATGNKSNIYGADQNADQIVGTHTSQATGGLPRIPKGFEQLDIVLQADNATDTAAVNVVRLFDFLNGDNLVLPKGITVVNEEVYKKFRRTLARYDYSVGHIRVTLPNADYKNDKWASAEAGYNEGVSESTQIPLGKFIDPKNMDSLTVDMSNNNGEPLFVLKMESLLDVVVRKNTRLSLYFEFSNRTNISNASLGKSVVEVR